MKRWINTLAALALLSTPALAQNVLFPANQGDMIVKGATTWGPVPGGPAGYVLMSQGPTAAPTWSTALPLNFSLPPMATNRVWGNVSGVQGIPTQITVNQWLDTIGYDTLRTPTNGSMIYKDPATGTWQALVMSPVVGWALTSAGTGLAPVWAPVNGYIQPGAAGTCLVSNGPSVAPSYAACPTGAQVVNSVFGRTGTIVAVAGDYTVGQITGAASLASPILTGDPTAPTPITADNDTSIATTAFVKNQAYAPLLSPQFTSTIGVGVAANGVNPIFVKQVAGDTAHGIKIERGSTTDANLFLGYNTVGSPVSARNTMQVTASFGAISPYPDLTLNTGDTERVRITASGNFGLGAITTPTAQLHTNGTVRFANNTCGGAGGTATFDGSGNLTCSATAGARQMLSGNRTWYYRKDGSDANTCLTDSAGGACLTIQAVVNKAKALDFGGFTQTIQRGSDAGTQTWTEDIAISSLVGGGALTLTGNGTASATIINGTGAGTTAISASFTGATLIQIYGISITCGATGRGIFAGYQATVVVGVASPTTRFGACGSQLLAHNTQGLIQVLNAAIEIYGGGVCHVGNAGQFFYEGVTLTLTGTPAFSSGWWCQSGGFAQVSALTIASGTATGNKFNVSGGTLVPVSITPITAFPGSTTLAPFNGGAVGALPVVLGVQTIAQLPTCNANWAGATGYVYDNTINTWGSTVVGTGAVSTLVWCNAGAWTIVGK